MPVLEQATDEVASVKASLRRLVATPRKGRGADRTNTGPHLLDPGQALPSNRNKRTAERGNSRAPFVPLSDGPAGLFNRVGQIRTRQLLSGWRLGEQNRPGHHEQDAPPHKEPPGHRIPTSTRTRQAQPVNRGRPDLPVRISPLPGPLRGFLPPFRGSNQTRPLTSAHRRTRRGFTKPGTRELRGQQRRMDQHEERDMDKAGKMSEIDMQTASGLKDARNHRNATATRCSAWVRRFASSLFVFAALGTALPAAAQTVITLISNTGQGSPSAASSIQSQPFTTGDQFGRLHADEC